MMNPNIGELGSDKNQDTGFRDNTPQTPRLGFWSSHTGKRFGVLGNVPGK